MSLISMVSLTVPGHCRELQNRDNVHVSISVISSYPTGVREVPSRNMHIYTTLIVYGVPFAENRLFIPCPYMARWCSRKNVAQFDYWVGGANSVDLFLLRGKDAISPAASTVCTQMQTFAARDRSWLILKVKETWRETAWYKIMLPSGERAPSTELKYPAFVSLPHPSNPYVVSCCCQCSVMALVKSKLTIRPPSWDLMR